jgi:hypothetical protein
VWFAGVPFIVLSTSSPTAFSVDEDELNAMLHAPPPAANLNLEGIPVANEEIVRPDGGRTLRFTMASLNTLVQTFKRYYSTVNWRHMLPYVSTAHDVKDKDGNGVLQAAGSPCVCCLCV